MSTVADILARKGTTVHCVGPNSTVLEGAELMNENKIGALVVIEDDQIIGMFTDQVVFWRKC